MIVILDYNRKILNLYIGNILDIFGDGTLKFKAIRTSASKLSMMENRPITMFPTDFRPDWRHIFGIYQIKNKLWRWSWWPVLDILAVDPRSDQLFLVLLVTVDVCR